MNFLDGALFPENQDKLVITAAPYGPEWIPSDFPEDIAVTMDEQVQKAVDCYNAGATVLHVHVREADGKGRSGSPNSTSCWRGYALQCRTWSCKSAARFRLRRRPRARRPSGCRMTPATCSPS